MGGGAQESEKGTKRSAALLHACIALAGPGLVGLNGLRAFNSRTCPWKGNITFADPLFHFVECKSLLIAAFIPCFFLDFALSGAKVWLRKGDQKEIGIYLFILSDMGFESLADWLLVPCCSFLVM